MTQLMPPHAGARLFAYVCVRVCMCVRACCSQHGAPVNQRALLCCHFCIEKASTSFRERRVSHAETRSRLRTRSPEHKIRSSSKKFSHFPPPRRPSTTFGLRQRFTWLPRHAGTPLNTPQHAALTCSGVFGSM